jgi:hypothetical protein
MKESISDADKLVKLVELYLELQLGIQHALRAAEADLVTAFRAQNRRPTVEQPL